MEGLCQTINHLVCSQMPARQCLNLLLAQLDLLGWSPMPCCSVAAPGDTHLPNLLPLPRGVIGKAAWEVGEKKKAVLTPNKVAVSATKLCGSVLPSRTPGTNQRHQLYICAVKTEPKNSLETNFRLLHAPRPLTM
jgi:hypothetical protein